MKTLIFSKDQAYLKIKQYCAYQERSNAEVKEKLYSFSLEIKEVEKIILMLTEENYLDEKRFAIDFARGKFKIKHWGRVKIKYALKQKQVSDVYIKSAIEKINEDDYKKTLNRLAEQKFKMLGNRENIFIIQRKLSDYLLQKGYERILIKEVIDKRIM
ncbi:MAG: regulatory protein RecX [Ginsengibacter sp.]